MPDCVLFDAAFQAFRVAEISKKYSLACPLFMNTQKVPQSNYKKALSVKKAFRRFEDIKAEFFRIQWTEDKEVLYYTKIVLVAAFASAMLLYFADLFVQKSLFALNYLLSLIIG